MSKETNNYRKENASVLMIGNRKHIYIFFFDSEFFPILYGNSLITICIMHLATTNDSTALFVSYLRFSHYVNVSILIMFSNKNSVFTLIIINSP